MSSDLRNRAYSKLTTYLAGIMGISDVLPEHPGPLKVQMEIERYVGDFDESVNAYVLRLQEAKRSVRKRRSLGSPTNKT